MASEHSESNVSAKIIDGDEPPKKKIFIDSAKPRIETISVTSVCKWRINSEAENCAICRNDLQTMCIDCGAIMASDTPCFVTKGICNHEFHNHCIGKWLGKNNKCPLCGALWDTLSTTNYNH